MTKRYIKKKHLNRGLRYIICLLFLLPFFSISESDVLTVAVPGEGYAPFIIIEGDDISGILIEPFVMAAQGLDIKIKFVLLPEKRSQRMLDNQEIQARMESANWVDNPQDYLWSEPITPLNDVFVFHKDSETDFESNQSLEGAEIITHLGYGYPTLQTQFDQNFITRKDYPTEHDMLKALSRHIPGLKRAAVMNQQVALWIIGSDKRFRDKFKFTNRLIGTADLQFQFPKTEALEDIVARLNLQLRKLKADGIVSKIADRILPQ